MRGPSSGLGRIRTSTGNALDVVPLPDWATRPCSYALTCSAPSRIRTGLSALTRRRANPSTMGAGAPGRIRTCTRTGFEPVASTELGHGSPMVTARRSGPGGGGEIRTHTIHGLSVVLLPVGVRPLVIGPGSWGTRARTRTERAKTSRAASLHYSPELPSTSDGVVPPESDDQTLRKVKKPPPGSPRAHIRLSRLKPHLPAGPRLPPP
jgi:hypothetical protein